MTPHNFRLLPKVRRKAVRPYRKSAWVRKYGRPHRATLRWNDFTSFRWDEGRSHSRRDLPSVRFAWLGRRRAGSTGSRDCPPSARPGRVAREWSARRTPVRADRARRDRARQLMSAIRQSGQSCWTASAPHDAREWHWSRRGLPPWPTRRSSRSERSGSIPRREARSRL
jgi:hypothetical protein